MARQKQVQTYRRSTADRQEDDHKICGHNSVKKQTARKSTTNAFKVKDMSFKRFDKPEDGSLNLVKKSREDPKTKYNTSATDLELSLFGR